MSIRVMTWVWENSRAEGIDRLVLLAIADSASDDGGNAWPSVLTLAGKAKVNERTVQRSVRRLSDLGELVVGRNAGRNGVNVYRIIMNTPADSHPGTEPPRTEVAPDLPDSPHNGYGAESPRQTVTPAQSPKDPGTESPEPSLNHPTTKNKTSSDRGMKIPNDWKPSIELIAWARSEGIPDDLARRETEKFVDYWRGIPGIRGRKSDWPGTWRNWLRKAVEDNHRPGKQLVLAGRGNQTASPHVLDGLALAERLRGQGE